MLSVKEKIKMLKIKAEAEALSPLSSEVKPEDDEEAGNPDEEAEAKEDEEEEAVEEDDEVEAEAAKEEVPVEEIIDSSKTSAFRARL